MCVLLDKKSGLNAHGAPTSAFGSFASWQTPYLFDHLVGARAYDRNQARPPTRAVNKMTGVIISIGLVVESEPISDNGQHWNDE